MKKILIVLIVLGFVVTGCAQRKIVTPETKQPSAGTQEMQKKEGTEAKAPEKITEQKLSQVESKELVTGRYAEEEGTFKDVQFDYDKYDIRDADKPTLKSISAWLLKNKSAKLLIEGHCDERGTNEYNLALGDRRAKAVRDYLLSLGVQSAKMDIISYGEEKPLCSEKTEVCWQKNRRAHFVVLKETGK